MRAKSKQGLPTIHVESLIRVVRDQRVILDSDLAKVYGIPTFRFNEAVKRNHERFPEDFMFQLSIEEFGALTSQIAISKGGRGGRRTPPYAFDERWKDHERNARLISNHFQSVEYLSFFLLILIRKPH